MNEKLVKDNFKKLFESKYEEIFDVLWANENMKKSLFVTSTGIALDRATSFELFKELSKDTTSKLFSFLIVN